MKYFVAIDAGGTKTDTVLFDEKGHILLRDLSVGNNALDIGKPAAIERLLDVLERVTAFAPKKISAIFGGITGVMPLGDFFSAEVLPKNYADSVRFDGDGPNVISSSIGHRNGCGMVCGTGSSCFIRIGGQPLQRVGGKGYLIDTGGSGFELGRDAIAYAFRVADGRCAPSVLFDLVRQKMACEADDWLKPIYDPKTGGRAFIASFAPLVFEGRHMGDWACRKIFEQGSAALADLTFAAAKHFEGDFSVVMSGGIFAHFPEYVASVRAKSSPRAKLILADAPPVFGAAVEALWDAGLSPDEDFKACFLREYARWQQKN
ncbi:MAG: hypothetical protein GX936_01865 [Clostridiales bacterium]|nr:hypothetical protein [Clostridiales bacterium]